MAISLLEKLKTKAEECEQLAEEYGYSFAQVTVMGERSGVSIEYMENCWSGAVFTAEITEHTKLFKTMGEAIEAIESLESFSLVS